ncbi:hypothetical protein [Ekhidna sp.]|uniref:hypothetical protein n=1 Tax=Ekhidna sp. TaxID=2608089 RepID=UPI0032989AE7
MQLKISSFIIIIVLLIQCKSANVGQVDDNNYEVTPVILLLTDEFSPADLELIKSVQIESMKRISRSQNQWMIKVNGSKEDTLSLIEKLKADEHVQEAYIESSDQSDTVTNTKSGKSDTN